MRKKTYLKNNIRFHRHSRNGMYTMDWYTNSHIGWYCNNGKSGIMPIEDFRCVAGKQPIGNCFVLELQIRDSIQLRMYTYASKYTTEQLRDLTNKSNRIELHYWLNHYKLI